MLVQVTLFFILYLVSAVYFILISDQVSNEIKYVSVKTGQFFFSLPVKYVNHPLPNLIGDCKRHAKSFVGNLFRKQAMKGYLPRCLNSHTMLVHVKAIEKLPFSYRNNL